jgi:hypothetical protein
VAVAGCLGVREPDASDDVEAASTGEEIGPGQAT